MIEEAARFCVQRCNRSHVFRAEFKIEHVEILHNALFADGLGNGHHAALGQPAQDDLRHGFLVFSGKRNQQLVLENVVFAFGKRPPGFNLHPVLLQELLGFDLLVEWMGFDLVHSRRHLVMTDHVHDPVRLEVAEADGADPAFLVQLFHRPPGAVHIPNRVGGSGTDPGNRAASAAGIVQTPCLALSYPASAIHSLVVMNNSSRGTPASFDGFADGFLIAIRSRGINQTVAGLDGFSNAPFTFFGIGDLKDAEPEHGHLHPVVQCDQCIADIVVLLWFLLPCCMFSMVLIVLEKPLLHGTNSL